MVARHTMNDDDNHRWPYWLEEIYGPWPEGPRRRAEALRQDAERRREIERRLAETAKL